MVHQFICRSCGSIHPKWMGRCPDCGTWDAMEEHRESEHGAELDGQRGTAEREAGPAVAVPLSELRGNGRGETATHRLSTGIQELDRVLGGPTGGSTEQSSRAGCGIVPGSAVLVGGDPGIGKSTLLLQAAGRLADAGQRVLYVTSEESVDQLQIRARRLNTAVSRGDELYVLADTNLARIVEQIRKTKPQVVVIDSIQMIYKGDVPAAPGSVTQLRTCCLELVYLAKAMPCAVLFVGHVTKQGQLAGPRLLEHLVDTVLYFEGDRYHSHRIVRAIKNRYGTTLEVGLFEMTDAGLEQVTDGAGLLASEYSVRSGGVVCPVLQGSRCLLVEVQALTATGFPGSTKRKTSGVDANRLAMLIAVLEKRGGHRLADQDIFVSSVGGMRIIEPAADLAIALAVAGAHLDRSLNPGANGDGGTCAVGEIGLGGEIRHVYQMEQRLREAARLGFRTVIGPRTSSRPPSDCRFVAIEHLQEGLAMLA